MKIEEALAREGIRETLSRYNLSGDRGRLEELVDCFTADGILEIEGEPPCRGRDAILARLRGAIHELREPGDGPGLLRHHLTTSGIELVAPDTARAWSYFLAVTASGLDHSGRYVDELRNEGDRWRLVRRRVRIDWHASGTRFARTLGPPREAP